MIVIKEKDFEMVQVKSGPFFDLKVPTIVNKGKENERIEMEILGYGMTFESCVHYLVGQRMSKDCQTYTMSEYLKKYRELTEEISNLIKNESNGV